MQRSPQAVFKDLVKLSIDYRGRRKEIVREYLFDLLAPFAASVSVDTEVGRFFVSTRDKEIGRTLFARGGHDDLATLGRVIDHLRERTSGAFTLDRRTFVDIGANIGTTTVAAITAFDAGLVYAFEAAPENYGLLRQNIVANQVEDRVVAAQVAVSDHGGVVDLELSSWNSGDHRVRAAAGTAAASDSDVSVVAVRAATLDALVQQQRIELGDVALIWIDVQGHEPSVLAGARRTVGSGIPVVVEYWPHGLGETGLERLEELVRAGFGAWADAKGVDERGRMVERPVAEIGELRAAYRGLAFTDLLLLPDLHGSVPAEREASV
jgi:FkbM family methyltransferase